MVHINEGKDKLALLYTVHNVLSTPPFSILFPSSIFSFSLLYNFIIFLPQCFYSLLHRSHLRAIMAVDDSRSGLENKFLENKMRLNFLRSTSLLYKTLPINVVAYKPAFYTFYTSHLR